MLDYQKRLKTIFTEVFEGPNVDLDVIKQHFHADYQQWVDGEQMDFMQFVRHLKALKAAIGQVHIELARMVVDGNTVCVVHYPEGVKADGEKVRAKVISIFQFRDDKLLACEELTFMVAGSFSANRAFK